VKELEALLLLSAVKMSQPRNKHLCELQQHWHTDFFVSTECEQNVSVAPLLPFKFHAKYSLFASNLELFKEENSGKYDSHLTKLT
jgi:hypothetical protein